MKAIKLLFLFLLAMSGASVYAQPPIRVLVYGQHVGTNIVYQYTVINNGTAAFNNFTIGSEYDPAVNYTYPQLGKLPLGTKEGRQGETGPELILDPGSTTQPQGWVPWVYGQQDSGFYYFKWRIPSENNKTTPFLQPGQTLSGFSVTVPKEAEGMDRYAPPGSGEMYLNGSFEVGYWLNRKHYDFRATLERQDTTPPVLSVTLTPHVLSSKKDKDEGEKQEKGKGKLVPIVATITVKDDYDPAPEIKLESITANEPLESEDIKDAQIGTDDRQFKLKAERESKNKAGRIYTVTYSATDGSGNKATATATVVVPHDERKKDD